MSTLARKVPANKRFIDVNDTRAALDDLLNRFSSQLIARLAVVQSSESDAGPADPITQRLQKTVALLGQVAAGLEVVEPDSIPANAAGFGSALLVRDVDTGETAEYTLMVGSLVDIGANQVSLASPIGQALLGTVQGDEISIQTPMRRIRLRVLRVRTLEDLLEGHELRIAW